MQSDEEIFFESAALEIYMLLHGTEKSQDRGMMLQGKRKNSNLAVTVTLLQHRKDC